MTTHDNADSVKRPRMPADRRRAMEANIRSLERNAAFAATHGFPMTAARRRDMAAHYRAILEKEKT